MRHQIRAHPALADAALACFLMLAVMAEVLVGSVERASRLPNLVTAPLMTLPLALRQRFPAAVAITVVAAVKVQGLLGGSSKNTIVPILPLSLAMYSLAAHAEFRRLVAASAAVAVLLVIAAGQAQDALFAGILLAVPYGLGLAVRSRQRKLDSVEAEMQKVVAVERQRIARELHDVIAHSVGVMTVQAAAGRRVLESQPVQAAKALAAIETIGRDALTEMQRLIGILREQDDAHSLVPQPQLRQLPTLVEQMRAAGIEVHLELDSSAVDDAPRGLELAAYRIVQEALTNCLRHSRAQTARVTVNRTAQQLEIEIWDPGPPRAGSRGGGHGLVGMRERAQLYDGELSANATEDGGYLVRAQLRIAR